MRKTGRVAVLVAAAFSTSSAAHAQEREDRTLLSWDQMRAIVSEASGERAMQTVTTILPFPRLRSRAEYEGRFRETEEMARLAREHGLSDVQIETYAVSAPLWNASEAELWEVEPHPRKLYDAHDVNIAVVSGSASGDVTAEVVTVGEGARPEDYAGLDVKGKIVLGAAQAGMLQRMAVFERGAAGVVSYESHRADALPSEVLDQEHVSVPPPGKQAGFAWAVSPRVARELIDEIQQGRRVRLRSLVKAETFPGKQEMVHAMIPGDGSSTQEIMVSAHLHELHLKQGANDNGSGCGVTLEMARTLTRLVADGKLPRPKRNIHFTWVDEFRGTREWLKKHDDVRQRLIADLNFDQAGAGLRLSSSFYVLHRTPDTTPTFLNDLAASVLEFVARTNRERSVYRTHGYGFSLPVVAPTGSDDPFYALVDRHFGASDHRMYLDQGVPAVLFNDWPDMWYHSSFDRAYLGILDATQMKRAAVVGTGALSLLAAADDAIAARIAFESLGRGAERVGQAARRGLGYLADAADTAALAAAYKDARNAIRHQSWVESAVVRSAAVLFPDPAAADKRLASLQPLIDARASALQAEIAAAYRMQAEQRHVVSGEPAVSDAERQASRQIPERTMPLPAPGVIRSGVQKLSTEDRAWVEPALAKLPDYMTAEFNILLGRKKTVLEIRDFLSGEFEPLALADLAEYLRAQEKLGYMKRVDAPAAPAKAKGAPRAPRG
jgi:Zn-dependent M28 family amino/carboxypeptidase